MILNLENLSKELVIKLKLNSLKLGTAESCTGGMIAQYLTMHTGSSEIFSCGLVTYSNESKINLLGIKELEIKKYGAVSKEVASAMALNLLKQNNIDISIAVSGIAGPGGGTEAKPVGLVHHVMAIKNKLIHKELIYNGDRETIRKQTVQTCLKLILSEISQL
jgi:PncC family amidohydrolase